MRRPLSVGAIALFVLILAATAWRFSGTRVQSFDTPYEAILLDNGTVYYAHVDEIGDAFTRVHDVYYMQNQIDTATKQTRVVLVRRGSEWHSPDRGMIASRHIVMIEPVGTKSRLADWIAALEKSKS